MDLYLSTLSLSDTKAFLNIPATETDADAWLTREIGSQLQAIEVYLDRPVVVRQFREDVDGTGRSQLILNYAPVQSIASLNIDSNRVFGASTRYAADAYFIDGDGISLWDFGFFPRGIKNVRVSYFAGFAEIEIPFTRQRFDIREVDGGRLLTVYLPAGTYTPTVIAEMLEEALNTVGDAPRTVSFDYVQRCFMISQASGYLQVVTSLENTFTASDSAAGLIGWSTDTVIAEGALKSGVVSIGIPEVLTLVALENIAEQYQRGAYQNNHYGIQSYWLDDYRVIYEKPGQADVGSSFSMKHQNLLAPFKRWTLF